MSFNRSPESIIKLGKAIAHELGYYAYGLLDEHVEEGRALDPKDPGAPSQCDNAKNTIMNDQNAFVSFSTPADYADPSTRQTAQARVMAVGPSLSGGSAWETLTRPADQDPVRASSQGRTFFEAFRGIDPATLQLKRPVTGFDESLDMVPGPSPQFRDVIVVDRTLAPDRFADLIQAAKALVGQAKVDMQFAISVSPPAATADAAPCVVLGYTDTLPGEKQTLSAALDALQPVQAGIFDRVSAFTQAYRLLTAVRKPGDMFTLHLLTGAQATLLIEAASSAVHARVSVNPMGLTGGTGDATTVRATQARAQSAASSAVGLAQLAEMTGRSFNRAKTGAEAAKDAVRAINETHAAPFASLSADASPALAARGSFTSSFSVAGKGVDGEVTASLFFDPTDAAKLKFSMIAPNGADYSNSSAPASVEFDIDSAYGEANFVIAVDAVGRAGRWTVRAEASAQTADGVGLEVSSDSLVKLTGELRGGMSGNTILPTLFAKLGGEKSIKGAVVTTDVYDADGKLVLAAVVLKGDGVLPDLRAGDGQYAASLAELLHPGGYSAIFTAVTNSSSRIASLGALIKVARDEELPVEVIGRVSEFGFTLEANALGVVTPVVALAVPPAPSGASASSGSGCSVNPQGKDAGLPMLLLLALAGAAMRRRPFRRATKAQAESHGNNKPAT